MSRRLHPAGIAVLGARALQGAVVPVIVAVFVGGGGSPGRALLIALIATVGAAVTGYASWRTTTYAVRERAIASRRGLLSVRETVVPLERIQALDTVQGPLQRLFGVTAVHVQAAGGGKEGEIRLEALSAEAVAELRAAVGRPARATDGAERPAPEARRRLSRGRLAVAALSAGQLGVILPVLAGGSQVFDDVLLGGDDRPGARSLDLLPDTVTEVALAAAVLLLAAWLLSILGTVVSFARFSVEREGERLLIRRGVLARREASVPLGRIQAVTVVEGLLRQPFGFASLRVDVAGYAAEAAAAQTLFPLLSVRELDGFLAELVPAFAGPRGPLERPPRRALLRYAWPPALVLGVPGAVVLVLLGLPTLAPLPALAGALYGLAEHRAEGVALVGERVVLRGRRLARRTVLVRRGGIQDHSLEQSPFQRRGRLAGLEVRAGAGTSVTVSHLDATAARRAFEAMG